MRFLSYPRTVWNERRRRAGLPRVLTYTVSFACNARCEMCDSWRKPREDELTTDEVARIFREFPRMDAVRLTGGEPFVRRDLTEIAGIAHRELRPFFLHVTTNGFLTDRIVEFCEERPRDQRLFVLVSVDGVGDKHDRVRGHVGAWEKAMATLEALAPRRKELRLTLGVNQTVVDREGAAHYPLLRDHLAPLGIVPRVVMAYEQSATYDTRRELDLMPTERGKLETFGDFGEDDIRALIEAVEGDQKRLPLAERWTRRYYLAGLRERLLGEPGAVHRVPPCVALSSHLRLFPDGTVPTCQFDTTRVGSLREQSFEELWWGADSEAGRERVRACPGCWAECEVLPNAIYSGDIASLARRSAHTIA